MLLSYVLVLSVAVQIGATNRYSEFVSTFIGSGGEGFGVGSQPPGAQLPFGFCRLSPDTVLYDNIYIPWNHCGGYYYGDTDIRAFSHVHLAGAGVAALGLVGVMPYVGPVEKEVVQNYGFRSQFTHEKEVGLPGYYAVTLTTNNIRVELTAAEFTGFHRYTFPSSSQQNTVLFPVSHTIEKDGCNGSYVEIVHNETTNKTVVQGFMVGDSSFTNRIGGLPVFFSAQLSCPMSGYGVWANYSDVINNGVKFSHGIKHNGAYIQTSASSCEVTVGLSLISLVNAISNRVAEDPGSFDAARAKAGNAWNTEFSNSLLNVTFANGNNKHSEQQKFFTSFYHSRSTPTQYAEPTGRLYVGFDKKVHTLPINQGGYYSDLSIWDVHRTQMPLLSLLDASVMQDVARSLLLMFQQGGALPRWPLAFGDTGSMIGVHATVLLADAYAKGIRGFDIELAFKAMFQACTQNQPYGGRAGVADWIKYGFIPDDVGVDSSACRTLAAAYDDYVTGMFALAIGKSQPGKTLVERAQGYKHVFHPKYKFFCPKSTTNKWDCPDTWIDVFDPRYTEGDAWHYRFNVPHDMPGLIDLFGGNSSFIEALTEFLERSTYDPFNVLPNPYFWAGNEEDLLAPYLFNFGGRPDLTVKYVRFVIARRYLDSPDGLPGNDDYGTMSSWLFFSYIDIVGAPSLQAISLKITSDGGQQLDIVSHGDYQAGTLVKVVLQHSKDALFEIPADNRFVSHSDIMPSAQNPIKQMHFYFQ